MAAPATSRTYPWSWYSDPQVLRLEEERVFRRHWQYVARTDQVAEPGRIVATRAGHVPMLLARGRDGALRGFLNVCRHRGAVLVDGEATRETIQCPYHAWTYELDGTLRAAPRSDGEPGFDRSALGLVPVSVEAWGPFVFACPDPEAEPLAEALGDVPERLLELGLDVEELRFLERVEGEYDANWKICCENYLECYHCSVAHPGFSKVVDVAPDAYRLEAGRLHSSQYGPVREGWSGPFDPSGPIGRGQFHFLFPNTALNVMPGHPNLSIGPIVPLGPERTYRWLDYFAGPDTPPEWVAEMRAFDDQVGAEDRLLVERVQAGVRAAGDGDGCLLPRSEQLVAHFQALLVDALGDGAGPFTGP